MSLSSFSHRFQKAVGFSPYSYILNRRLDEAKNRLVASDSTVAVIGETVGFKSPANFCKQFRKRNGMTPGEFRQYFRNMPVISLTRPDEAAHSGPERAAHPLPGES